MARQGLMDDSGYDFFDVSDCSNYESCREDAFKDGYEKGRADQKEEDNAFFNFEGAWELEKKKVRADAIDELLVAIKKSVISIESRDRGSDYSAIYNWIEMIAKRVKEQNK